MSKKDSSGDGELVRAILAAERACRRHAHAKTAVRRVVSSVSKSSLPKSRREQTSGPRVGSLGHRSIDLCASWGSLVRLWKLEFSAEHQTGPHSDLRLRAVRVSLHAHQSSR